VSIDDVEIDNRSQSKAPALFHWDKVVIRAGLIEVYIRLRDTRDLYLPIVMQPRIRLSGLVMPNWSRLFSIRARS
jgi:hypothetical protein